MKQPLPLAELKKARKPIRDINAVYKERLTSLERFAVWITKRVGTMGFLLLILTWTILWLGWNVLAPSELTFDPYPAFVLWLLISNMIQLFLMPMLLIVQNLQGKHAEARAEADYEVNTKAEREVETVLEHLENQNEMTLAILKKLEK
ncbi:MAG: DUF1003 domain-containing protein [bacterium]|nr:DUF1003 domain-containing protein [bacterium]